jgi:antitoxin YefM
VRCATRAADGARRLFSVASAISSHRRADVAELVDAHGSGPCRGNPVEVRVLSSALVGHHGSPAAFLSWCTRFGTLSFVAKTIPVREFRSNLAELLSDVADRRDHVVVTRNGRPAAALVPIDEYQALEETAEILSDAATLEALQAGLDELARGETIEFSDLRLELAKKRAAR